LFSYIWQYFCRRESGQEGASRQPLSRLTTVDEVTSPGTVTPVCLGPPKCMDVIYNHTNLPRSVLSICNTVLWWNCDSFHCFINQPLPCCLINGKLFNDSNLKSRNKWEETFVWVQKAADGSEETCKLSHCDILPRISNLSNHEKSEKDKRRNPLHGQTQINVRKTSRQDKDKVAVSMTCHCAIRTRTYSWPLEWNLDNTRAWEYTGANRVT